MCAEKDFARDPKPEIFQIQYVIKARMGTFSDYTLLICPSEAA
jgi:hypothetical protein